MINWIKDRLRERTSWDRAVLIAMGIVALMFQGIVTWAAYAAIVYGLWTIWKSE